MDNSEIVDWFPAGARNLSLLQSLQTDSRVHPPSYSKGTWGSSQKVRRAEAWSWALSFTYCWGLKYYISHRHQTVSETAAILFFHITKCKYYNNRSYIGFEAALTTPCQKSTSSCVCIVPVSPVSLFAMFQFLYKTGQYEVWEEHSSMTFIQSFTETCLLIKTRKHTEENNYQF
jgi:hypothetical protein